MKCSYCSSAALFGLMLGFVVALAAPGETALSRRGKLALRSATANRTTLPRYDLLELALNLEATYENPFAPEDIDVYALFTAPAGRQVRVNGFLYQPFTRRLENNAEKIEPSGEPVWKIRFTPNRTGTWRYQIHVKDRSGSVSLPEMKFQVTESTNAGFIRISVGNPLGFAWDNGDAFFGVGENMCWGGGRGSFDYDQWLPELAQAGGNYMRIWMSSWNCALEWSQSAKEDWRAGQYHGVGVYSLDNAWKLETILDGARLQHINVMLCLGTYGEFTDGGYFNEGQWKANPYNKVNGGPCEKPADFWTDPAARKLYQRRLRYLAARFGHYTNLQAWEFWNEAKAPATWVREMAQCLKGVGEFKGKPADPYGHLVTTTYGNPDVWKIPEIDFTQTHYYGQGNISDHSPIICDDARKHATYGKPHLMAEFGIDWRDTDAKYDPDSKGVNLHNGLWSSVCSGNAGSAMIWYWDNYVHPKGLYLQYGAVRRFVDHVPWNRGLWRPLQSECRSLANSSNTTNSTAPEIQVCGLRNDRLAIAWLHNSAHNWKNLKEKRDIPPVSQSELIFQNIPAGPYEVEWWDTHKGEITRRQSLSAIDNKLTLGVPELPDDLALRIVGH